jgi:dGTPase
LDDALDHGLITTEQLQTISLWKEAEARMSGRFCFLDENRKRRYLIRCLIDTLVEDLCAQSTQKLKATTPATAQDARTAEPRLIDYSASIGKQLKELRQFLYQHFYYHPQIKKIKERSASILEKLFTFYLEHPEHMGDKFHHRLERESLHRTVCDYVSGMTDRYALQVYAEYINPDDAQEVFQTL